MDYTVVYTKVEEPGFPSGYYYAHIPTLDLTTHGMGIEGAKAAAEDLVNLWVEEKQAAGETLPLESDMFTGKIHVADALHVA